MYLSHYDLKVKPFQITVDPKFLWLGEKHKEALSTLRYGIIENKGFLLLTGEVGTGKTVLINQLVKMLDLDTIVTSVPDPDLESLDFFKVLAEGFGFKEPFKSKGGFLLQLREFLLKSYEDKQRVLLIIDECQRLNDKLLEEIRLLSNIELHDRKLINIFFVGQSEFFDIISDPRNRAVTQRIALKYNIDPLDEKETAEFIHHRLSVAGTEKKIFTKDAVHEVFLFSRGIPRLINVICDHSLLTGYARSTKKIDVDIVKECASELRIPLKKKRDAVDLQSSVDQLRQQRLLAIGGGIHKTVVKKTEGDPKASTKPVPLARPKKQPTAAKPIQPAESEGEIRSRSVLTPIVSICFALLLFGAIIYGLVKFQSADAPQWDVEELTPQKYEDSLKQEKRSLEEKLASGEHDDAETGKDAVQSADAVSKAVPSTPPGSESDKVSPAPSDNANAAGRESSTVPPEPPKAAPRRSYLPGELIRIQFDLNSNEISPQDLEKLDDITAYLNEDPSRQIYVKGYTDSIGAPSYNLSVSQFRANIVKSYLIGKGAPKARIKTFALGSENPIAPNNTSEGRSKNRRVEVEIVKKTVKTNQN